MERYFRWTVFNSSVSGTFIEPLTSCKTDMYIGSSLSNRWTTRVSPLPEKNFREQKYAVDENRRMNKIRVKGIWNISIVLLATQGRQRWLRLLRQSFSVFKWKLRGEGLSTGACAAL